MLIPKVIYQTTSSRRQLPTPFVENLERMRRINPNWSIEVFDDRDCVEFVRFAYGAEMLRTYELINPRYGAARADLFRYLLLYRQGGVYLDIKSTVTCGLNKVLLSSDHYLLSHWANAAGSPFEGWGIHAETPYPGEFQQWHVVAAPTHPLLERVIVAVQRNIHSYDPGRDGTGKRAVLRMTGPIAYTQAIKPLLDRIRPRLVDIAALGFRYSFLDPDNSEFQRTGRMVHEALMPTHYRGLTEPLVIRC